MRRRTFLRNWLSAASVLPLGACTHIPRRAHLGRLYSAAAQDRENERNPIIVIPGILGTRLRHRPTDELVWGLLGGVHAGKHLGQLALPMRPGVSLEHLSDEVGPDGVLDRISVTFGATLSVKAYAQLLAMLGAGGYRDETLGGASAVDYGAEHYTCFQFPYDWRRSCVENAAALERFIVEKRRYVAAERRRRNGRTEGIKFDIVAHSMGGLVARYYLRFGGAPLPADGATRSPNWAGAKNLGKVILVGTPNAGSAQALRQLVAGYQPAPLMGTFPAAVLGTMPSIYQLLPHGPDAALRDATGREIPVLDPEEWASRGWGLADPDQADVLKKLLPAVADGTHRREIALDHQRKCLQHARQFQNAMNCPCRLPEGLTLALFAGDSVPTVQTLRVDTGARLFTSTVAPGDGVVTRKSALFDPRPAGETGPLRPSVPWTQTMFIAADHLGITRDPTFADNVLHLLLER